MDWSGLTKEMAGTSPRNWCAPPDRNLHERAVFYGRLSGKAIRVSFSIRSWSTPLSPRASLSRQPTLTIVRLVRLKDPANSEDVYGFALALAGSHSRVHAHLWLASPTLIASLARANSCLPYRSRNTFLSSLPTLVLGKASRKTIRSGTLYLVIIPFSTKP